MVNPVVTCDGHIYEEEAIKRWFAQGKQTSPLTNLQLASLELQQLLPFLEAANAYLAARPELQQMARQAAIELPRANEEVAKLRSQLVDEDLYSTCAAPPASESNHLLPSKRLRAALESAQAGGQHEAPALRDELLLAKQEMSSLIEAIALTHDALGLPRDAWCGKRRRKLSKAVPSRGTKRVVRKNLPPMPPATYSECPTDAIHPKLVELAACVKSCEQSTREDLLCLQAATAALTDCLRRARGEGLPEAELCKAERVRRRAHNMVEDRKGAIRVFCRVRPISGKEKAQEESNVVDSLDGSTVSVDGRPFSMDAVFLPTALGGSNTQDEVFDDCKDLIQSAMDGCNVTLFAYGQTGAGKTYTTYGTPDAPGLAPRMVEDIFRIADRDRSHMEFTVHGSMMELYRQDLCDLLHQDGPSKKLQPRLKDGKVVIENLTEVECRTADDLWDVIQQGSQHRKIRHTAMNSESSRSHLVMMVRISGHNKQTEEMVDGKILLVDLAGSERLTKSQVTGDGAKEAIEINKSLTALGDVLEALTKGSKQVPYRNHKLTMLMQDALGGTSKTLMFVTCSPAASNMPETLASLKWATRLKKITNTGADGSVKGSRHSI